MQSFVKEVFTSILQERNLSVAKDAFQISNSGCQMDWEGCSVVPQLSLPSFPLVSRTNSSQPEGIHCSQLLPGYFVRHCVRSPRSLLEAETQIVKPVEGTEGQAKTLGQVGT